MKAPDIAQSDVIYIGEENIQFIRKDALLEWAKEELKGCDSAVAMQRAYNKLIDKLNSL